jgi:hypothetical protein
MAVSASIETSNLLSGSPVPVMRPRGISAGIVYHKGWDGSGLALATVFPMKMLIECS